jgi:hypothetical protein
MHIILSRTFKGYNSTFKGYFAESYSSRGVAGLFYVGKDANGNNIVTGSPDGVTRH